MAAEIEDVNYTPQQGLVGKYHVERIEDITGKHDKCRYFVLDPVHDPLAAPVIRLYAQLAASEGKQELARDLEALVSEAVLRAAAERASAELRDQCPHAHPTTGNLCIRKGPHEDHEALGEKRMQLFGPSLRRTIMREDNYTNTEADAAAHERLRGQAEDFGGSPSQSEL